MSSQSNLLMAAPLPEIIISVVIPTYNRCEKFLPEAIRSVQRQNWEVVDHAYEIIVVNDGSTDQTQEVLDSLMKDDPNLLTIKHDKNRGIAQTLNTGFRNAKGKYICWLSDDDKWFKNKIKVQYPLMEANPHCVMSYSDYTNNDLRHDTIRYSKVFEHNPQDVPASLRRLFTDCYINGSTIMILKEVFEAIGNFSELEENKWNNDLEYWFRVLMTYKNILYINKSLVMRTNHYLMLSEKFCSVGNEILLPKMLKRCQELGIVL